MMTSHTATRTAAELRRRLDLPGATVPAMRRALLLLDEARAADALAQVEALGDPAPLFAAVKRQRRDAVAAAHPKSRTGAGFSPPPHPPRWPTPEVCRMSRTAAERLVADFAGVLDLSTYTCRHLVALARLLGEDATRDALADAWEHGSCPIAELERLAAACQRGG